MKVYQAYRDRGEEKIVVAKSGGKVQPLFGIYPKAVLGVMEAMILEGDYKMRNLLDKLSFYSPKVARRGEISIQWRIIGS